MPAADIKKVKDHYRAAKLQGGDNSSPTTGQILAALTDLQVFESYQRTDPELGDPYGDALLVEIERRIFDI